MKTEDKILEQLAIEQDKETQFKEDVRSEYREQQRREDDECRGESEYRNWNLN